MKISFLAAGNYPFTPPKIYGEGVGGAEYILMFLCQALAAMGHEVRVYNDCGNEPKTYDNVRYIPLNQFDKMPHVDILVAWRVSYHGKVNADRLVFHSTDQYTDNQWAPFLQKIDRMLCISNYHRDYIVTHYNIDPTKVSTVYPGVNTFDYADNTVKKVRNKLIFCSVPHRGLYELLTIWPRIKKEIPSAQLVVTSDYRLWGAAPNNSEFTQLAQLPGVRYYGKIPRLELVWNQMTSEVMSYPCKYEECFCIAAAECITAGAIPVTTRIGALPETVNSMGKLLAPPDSPEWSSDKFIAEIVHLLTDGREELEFLRRLGRQQAGMRFTYARMARDFLDAVML